MNILYADDDCTLLSLVKDMLENQGFIVTTVQDGQAALDSFFSSIHYNLVILDIMMPKQDGWEVLKEIRAISDVPVMMLTALDDESHEIIGFSKGVDEYIGKPFSYDVFLARVNALVRREKKALAKTLQEGTLYINQQTQRVFSNGDEIVLNHKEYQLLIYLIRNKGIVLTREMILNYIWGFDFDKDQRTVDTHIKMLRAKLASCGTYIQTIWGSGYKFQVEKL